MPCILCGQPSNSWLLCRGQVGGEASRASSDFGRSNGSAAVAGAKKRPKNGTHIGLGSTRQPGKGPGAQGSLV